MTLSVELRCSTTMLQNASEHPFYVLKMHANLLSAEKIQRGCAKDGCFEISIYKRRGEKRHIVRMARDDICLVVQTQPRSYAGAIALVKVVQINQFNIVVSFLRYLNRKISIEELREIEPAIAAPSMIAAISEETFRALIGLEDK